MDLCGRRVEVFQMPEVRLWFHRPPWKLTRQMYWHWHRRQSGGGQGSRTRRRHRRGRWPPCNLLHQVWRLDRAQEAWHGKALHGTPDQGWRPGPVQYPPRQTPVVTPERSRLSESDVG